MTELKLCPFCGAIATSEVRVTQMGMGGDTDNVDFSIVCSSCGTYKTVRLKIAKTCVFLDVEKAMTDAIEAWNTRPEL